MGVYKMVNDNVQAAERSAGPDTDARQADILAKQPRILPLTGVQAAAAIVENTRCLRNDILGDDGPALELSEVPEIIPTLMRPPDLWNRVCDLSIQLQARGVLAPRDRQLAAARLAWLCQAPYVWAEQVKHGKNVGLTSEDSERITTIAYFQNALRLRLPAGSIGLRAR
jgi:hypothetical protein